MFLPNAYFVLNNNKLRSLTNLVHWLWWVTQTPTSLAFYTNYWLSPTGCCLLNTENDFEMRRIIKASAKLMNFAHRLIVPTVPSPMQMNSECRIFACLLNVYRILNNQLWSLTNPRLKHWLSTSPSVPYQLFPSVLYQLLFDLFNRLLFA